MLLLSMRANGVSLEKLALVIKTSLLITFGDLVDDDTLDTVVLGYQAMDVVMQRAVDACKHNEIQEMEEKALICHLIIDAAPA